ncbi:unnamed protein product [Ceutorhynchus assimilis]|uniref:UDENN domain-containing protein n=1 Tax=Ceutorhynchus assimilis TaxID=467358 RepID=A0A9P0DK39_9CUCU|nr:unnamed protein product [Ceutorhynchus assimilis]
MYKPPQNSNRVRSMKKKFENIESRKQQDVPISSSKLILKNFEHLNTVADSTPIKLNLRSSQSTKQTTPYESLTRNSQQLLSRQHSDPLKRNIKRTPAFRVDMNAESVIEPVDIQSENLSQKTLFETKVQQFHSVKSFEDNIDKKKISGNGCTLYASESQCSNAIIERCDVSYIPSDSSDDKANCSFSDTHDTHDTDSHGLKSPSRPKAAPRAALIKTPLLNKSRSSHNFESSFEYLRSKFNQDPILLPDALELPLKNISDNIYKSLDKSCTPNKNLTTDEQCNIIERDANEDVIPENIDLSLIYTEPIPKSLRPKKSSESSTSNESPQFESKHESIYTTSTLQLTDKKAGQNHEEELAAGFTDSLKVALKKPLPTGPPPKKPPRTFQHFVENVIKPTCQKNISFLHSLPKKSEKKNEKKGDPKYMLNKLQTALKSNKLLARKQSKVEVSTTSGEDSDDSVLFRSKSCRSLPKPPSETQDFDQSKCTVSSSGNKLQVLGNIGCLSLSAKGIRSVPKFPFCVQSVPEPIYAEPTLRTSQGAANRTGENNLHYMSTAIIPEDTDANPVFVGPRQTSSYLSSESASLSSLPSDVKIRYLIEHFEARRQMLPNAERPSGDHDRCAESVDCNKRVELLRNSLIRTIDQSFKSEAVPVPTTPRDDSDSEKNEEGKVASMVDRFNTYQKTAHKYQQPKIDTETLFYCCLLIEKVQDCAQIKLKFPPHADVHPDIQKLCFPESPDSPPLEGSSAAQTYTLLITNQTGDRTYGYCRRVLPEGSTHCLPLTYCILSKYRSPRFYKSILIELESRHGMQNKCRDELISQFYYKTFPKPGESISINLSAVENHSYENIGMEESVDPARNRQGTTTKKLVLTLHPDSRYEDADLEKLHKLPTDILLKIFSSLLLERKVILISSVMSELSSCVESLQSILYPFTWYHTFIPILPQSLWVIVDCPTPFVCGVLSQDAIKDRHIVNGMVVNLDTRTVLVEEGDEMKILGSSLHKVWRQFITLANISKPRQYASSVFLADAYLNVLICCFRRYKQYIVDGKFLKDKLISDGGTRGRRRFLKMFTQTCMFQAFMDAALNNPESLAAFDKNIEFYGSDESRVILNKLIDWHR